MTGKTRSRDKGTGRIREGLQDRIVQMVIYLLVLVICAVVLFPCLNVLALSLNDGADAARGGIWLLPRTWTLENYRQVFSDGGLMKGYAVTIGRTVIGTLMSLVVTSLAAYGLKEKEMPGRALISFLITFTMLFGGGTIPTYIQYKQLGLLDSYLVYVIPSLVSVTYLMMMRNAIESIPKSLDESAQLDGCGYFRSFLMITMPLCKPVIAVVCLYTAVNHWNDWYSGAFYMFTDSKWPVQTVLQQMLARAMSGQQDVTSVSQALAQSAKTVTTDSLKMAAVVITTVPILCVYPFVQKYFTKGALIGAVKG